MCFFNSALCSNCPEISTALEWLCILITTNNTVLFRILEYIMIYYNMWTSISNACPTSTALSYSVYTSYIWLSYFCSVTMTIIISMYIILYWHERNVCACDIITGVGTLCTLTFLTRRETNGIYLFKSRAKHLYNYYHII